MAMWMQKSKNHEKISDSTLRVHVYVAADWKHYKMNSKYRPPELSLNPQPMHSLAIFFYCSAECYQMMW